MFFYIVLTPISSTSGLGNTGNARKYQQIDVYIYQCGYVRGFRDIIELLSFLAFFAFASALEFAYYLLHNVNKIILDRELNLKLIVPMACQYFKLSF